MLDHAHHVTQATSAHNWVDEAVVLTRESLPRADTSLWQRCVSEQDMELDGNYLLMDSCIIHPRSAFVKYWQRVNAMLVVCVVIFVPWQVRENMSNCATT